MASSRRKQASFISSIASCLFFFIIIFQVPLFSLRCTNGICKSPIEVTSSQLIVSELCPAYVVKGLLYPGAFANAISKNRNIPSYSKLLKLYNLTDLKPASAAHDLQRLEILAGSYLSVVGAVLGLFRPGRMSLFGTLLLTWGLMKEIISRKPGGGIPTKATVIHPAMLLAMICAFLSIRSDVRKLLRACRAKTVRKSPQSKVKFM